MRQRRGLGAYSYSDQPRPPIEPMRQYEHCGTLTPVLSDNARAPRLTGYARVAGVAYAIRIYCNVGASRAGTDLWTIILEEADDQ